MELTRFVYVVDGEPFVGTIKDYAKAVEHGHYSSLNVYDKVWTFSDGDEPTPVYHRVSFSKMCVNDDCGHSVVSIEFAKDDPEVATIRIDLNA